MLDFLSKFIFDFGVKLGSFNTSFVNQGRITTYPSLVACAQRKKKPIAFAGQALSMWGKTPANISVIQPIKRGKIVDLDKTISLVEYGLNSLTKEVNIWSLVKFNSTVFVSASSNLNNVERRFLARVFNQVGVNKIILLDKIILAGIGIGLNVFSPQGYLIIYIGGGTSYISLISLAGKVIDINLPFGGSDITSDLVHYFRRRYNLIVGWKMMEEVKLGLKNNKQSLIRGYDLSRKKMKSLTVGRQELEEVIFSSLNKFILKLRQVFNQIPPEFMPDINKNGIFLAGGGTKIYGLVKFLKNEFALTVNNFDQSEFLVVEGLREVLKKPDKYKELILNF